MASPTGQIRISSGTATVAVTITGEVYSDAAGASAASFPATISSATTYYVPPGTYTVTITLNGNTVHSETRRVQGGGDQWTVTPDIDTFSEKASASGTIRAAASVPVVQMAVPSLRFTGSNIGYAANGGHFTLVQVERDITADFKLATRVAVQAGNFAGALYRGDGTNNKPKTLLATSGAVAVPAASSNGTALSLGVLTLTSGLYWAYLGGDNASATFTGMDDPWGLSAGLTNVALRYSAAASYTPVADASALTLTALVAGTVTPGVVLVGN